ncbi:MAG TPA: hypothetical protein VG916_03215 [Gemmatimonadaceae bacterium]|nr:hypothetical protein [Gemmatimonadaceae bacterium]
MNRKLLGVALLLHALGHAGLGVWAGGKGPLVEVSILTALAMAGYLAAGFGLLRVDGFRRSWPITLGVATIASVMLFGTWGHGVFVTGALVDLAIIVAALRARLPQYVPEQEAARIPRHRVLRATASVGAVLAVAYTAVATLSRPLLVQWGSTPDERAAPMPGEEATMTSPMFYRIDHAVTVRAPADSVWPWLVQLGQDRAGFYSYDWLERLAGDRVHNADVINPAWQSLAVGGLVRAVQPGYLGGVFGDSIGWRVTYLDPGRVLTLENWGAFIVEPLDATTSRLIVRTRGEGRPSLGMAVMGPVELLVFEPAHFIMERGMLRGIRDRAEAMVARTD